MTEAYCSTCRSHCEIVVAVEDVMKNGRRTIQGKCATCGKPLFKVLRSEAMPSRKPSKPLAGSVSD